MVIPDEIRRVVKSGPASPDIYDQMQNDVVLIIQETLYPNFLRSDIYIQHVQNMQCGLGSSNRSTCSDRGGNSGSGGFNDASHNTATANQLQSSQYSGGSSSSLAGGPSQLSGASCGSGTTSTSSSSGTCSAQEFLRRSETLPTLHEDSELICDDSNIGSRTPIGAAPLKLTRDLLLATQNRRLEVRPPG